MLKINQLEKLTPLIRKLLAQRFQVAQKNKSYIDRYVKQAVYNFTIKGLTQNGLDSTGILHLDKLRNKLSSLVVNSNYIWAWIEPPQWAEVTDQDKQIFEDHTKKVFDTIQEVSNFEIEKAKILSDYLIGTAVFKINYTSDAFNPIVVEHTSLEDIYLGDDRVNKTNDVFYKKTKVSKYNLADSYGYEVLEIREIKQLSEDDKFDIYEATIEVRIENQDKIFYAAALDTSFRDIFYFEEIEYNPWVIARCELLPSSPYGCGPCIKAIMEIENLKKKKKNVAKIGDDLANPSYIAYTNDPKQILRSRLNTPGTISMFRDRGTEIIPFQKGRNIEVQMYDLSEHKEILRSLFYIDFITAIKDVEDLKNVTATATQVAVSKFAEQIEPMYSILQRELLKGIVMKTYRCCQMANLVNVEEIEWLKNNPRTSLRYYNAITIAQDQDDLQRANMYIQDIASKFGPMGVAAAIKPQKHIDELKRRYRVSSLEFNSGAEMEEQMQQLQQAQAQQEEAMQQQALMQQQGGIE